MHSIFQNPPAILQELGALLICYFCFTASAIYSLTPRFSKTVTMLSTFILFDLTYFHNHYDYNLPDLILISELLLVVPWTIIMFKDKFAIKLLFGITIIIMFCGGDIFEYALHHIIHQSEPDYSRISDCLITLLAIPPVVLLLTFIWNKITKKNKTNKINNNYNLIPVLVIGEVFIIMSFIILIYKVYDKLGYHNKVTVVTVSIVIASIIVLIDIVAFYSIFKNDKYQKLKTENEILEKTSIIQADYYNKIQENMAETAKIRHDIYNLISVTNILIEENSEESKNIAQENIKNIAELMEKTKTKYYCDNKLLNTVLYDKINTAEKSDIEVNTNIILDENCNIENFDLSRIFINIMDNAINALADYNGKKLISVSCKQDDNNTYIVCENPFEYKAYPKKKDKNHGYGLNIISDIAEKYSGNVIIKDNDNIFKILVTIPVN